MQGWLTLELCPAKTMSYLNLAEQSYLYVYFMCRVDHKTQQHLPDP